MEIEYLLLTKKSSSFCSNIESLKNFLKADTSIGFDENNHILFLGMDLHPILVAELNIKSGEISSKDERYFYLKIKCSEQEKIDEFAEFAEKIKMNLKKIDSETAKVNTLWNDVGRFYAKKAYPLINEVENLMRKLISQFMLINVGMDWASIAIHEDIKDKMNRKKELYEPLIDDLHKSDFIHLSDVLFQKYRTLSIEELNRKLSSAEKNSKLDFNEIVGFIPKSNWERYFSAKVDFKEETLKTKWSLLYELRNKVAHNTFLTKSDFDKITGLVRDLKRVINSSISKLQDIHLKEEEKEKLISSYSPSSMNLKANKAEKLVMEWYKKNYSNIELITQSERDFGFDLILVTKDRRQMGIVVKYVKDISEKVVLRNIEKTTSFLDNNISLEVDEIHVVFALYDQPKGVIEYFDEYKYDDKKMKLIYGYLEPELGFIPII
ncbi:HEPN domain-containing protein [Neobacillus mesonae]|uniref:Uncharacterized protein n=1 Tax=Neobacillus mesonae TaxID=1193713 RepID=A0A3Q9QZI4_9BACI|nr:HEPN domain-containing protein [Neobacillus mesonae]AZU62564.1 hypothetical protein CHR53_15520 [Neobacillus mesonae]